MEEDMAIIEAILREEAEFNGEAVEDTATGWKTVKAKTKPSRRNSAASITLESVRANGSSVVTVTVDAASDECAERRRRIVEAQRAAFEIAAATSGVGTSQPVKVVENEVETGDRKERTSTAKKKRMPEASVAEAAAEIDSDHLAAFLVDTSSDYEFQEDVQLTRFAEYFGRAFVCVSCAEFPWEKLLRESSVAKMIDIPLAHLPKAVYKVSVDWINQRSVTAVGSFVLRLWDGILGDDANYRGTMKGSKKEVRKKPSKSLVAIFMVLAMTLQRKPDVLVSLLPVLKESPKYFEQNMLPLNVWLISQALQGDLAVGLYMWVRVLLPKLSGKSTPYTRDLILQLGERILSSPKAQQFLLNGSIRKGERLVPPSALEILMRLTFPLPDNRIKATERLEAMYPTLKKLALGGFQSKKGLKRVSEQVFSIAIHAAAISNLSEEATDLAVWCLTVNSSCYEQWDNLYLDNIEASLTILRKLAVDWKDLSVKLSKDSLRKTLQHLRKKNQTALASKEYKMEHSSLKEADKQCRAILACLFPGHHWMKIVMIISVLLGICSFLLAGVPKLPMLSAVLRGSVPA